jgi:hypothetical protein
VECVATKRPPPPHWSEEDFVRVRGGVQIDSAGTKGCSPGACNGALEHAAGTLAGSRRQQRQWRTLWCEGDDLDRLALTSAFEAAWHESEAA